MLPQTDGAAPHARVLATRHVDGVGGRATHLLLFRARPARCCFHVLQRQYMSTLRPSEHRHGPGSTATSPPQRHTRFGFRPPPVSSGVSRTPSWPHELPTSPVLLPNRRGQRRPGAQERQPDTHHEDPGREQHGHGRRACVELQLHGPAGNGHLSLSQGAPPSPRGPKTLPARPRGPVVTEPTCGCTNESARKVPTQSCCGQRRSLPVPARPPQPGVVAGPQGTRNPPRQEVLSARGVMILTRTCTCLR